MSEGEFKKIEEYSNWCHYDQLDGKDLVNGENIEVKWPDDTITENVVIIKKSSYQYNDMGHFDTIPVKQAFVIITHRGHNILVRIKDLEAKRVG